LSETGLSKRALAAKNIHTIGTLVDGVFAGLVVLGNVGRQTFSESEDALSALSRSVGSNGCVDWLQYASNEISQSFSATNAVCASLFDTCFLTSVTKPNGRNGQC